LYRVVRRCKSGSNLATIVLVNFIPQSGFLLGYSIHEGLSALRNTGILAAGSLLFVKALDLSGPTCGRIEPPLATPTRDGVP